MVCLLLSFRKIDTPINIIMGITISPPLAFAVTSAPPVARSGWWNTKNRSAKNKNELDNLNNRRFV